VRLPGVPGPRDVLAAGERAVELVDGLLATVPRISALLDAAERLLDEARDVLARFDETRTTADVLVARADVTVAGTGVVVDGIQAATTGADALVVAATAAQVRLVELLDRLEPSLTRLQPTLERLAETTDPREVDALVGLVDRLPMLAEQVERDVVPVMQALSSVAPDLHDLLDTSRERNEMLAKVPGISRLRGRDH
jgi:hypothetical protein